MKSNPGGNIGPAEVVGRDRLIAHFWEVLERQSLVLSAERRMGKTSIIRKMKEEAPEGRITVFHDLEQVGTPVEFVQVVLRDIETYLARTQKISNQARELRKRLSGMKLGLLQVPEAVDPHWKTLLIETVEGLGAHRDSLVVFFWDEVPLMLEKIRGNAGEREAMDLMDTLRSLRQGAKNLRMVFTGSIGLHHVLTALRRSGYANTPINDMRREEVPPLTPEAGQDLACRLIEGEGLPVAREELAETGLLTACAVDCIPYFIHHVVGEAACRDLALNPGNVEEIVIKGLTHPLDAWDMQHYRERIDTYFSIQDRVVALKALDAIAHARGALAFDRIFNLVKAEIATEDQEQLLATLHLLVSDHYLAQDEEGAYAFKFPLVERWWRLNRGLGS